MSATKEALLEVAEIPGVWGPELRTIAVLVRDGFPRHFYWIADAAQGASSLLRHRIDDEVEFQMLPDRAYHNSMNFREGGGLKRARNTLKRDTDELIKAGWRHVPITVGLVQAHLALTRLMRGQ